MVHCTSTQILLIGITGGPFTAGGENIEKDGSNYVVSNGAQDGPIAVLECYDDWSGDGLHNQVYFAGMTTSEVNCSIVRVASGDHHDGTPDAGFRMYESFSNGVPLWVADKYFHFEGLVVQNTRNNEKVIQFDATTGVCFLDRCIVMGVVGSNEDVIKGQVSGDLEVTNTVCVGGDNGINLQTSNSLAYNCLATDCNVGFQKAAFEAPTLSNCVSFENTTNWGQLAYTAWAGTNNAASDGSSITPPGSNPITTNIVAGDFVDEPNRNYLAAIDSTLDSAGADLSASILVDNQNHPRTTGRVSSTFDLGSHNCLREITHNLRVSGATSPPPDYTLATSWESAQQRDLVNVDEIAILEGWDDWAGDGLNNYLYIDGWTFDKYRSAIFRAADGEGHDGTRGNGFRMWKDTYSITFFGNMDGVVFDHLQFKQTYSSSAGFGWGGNTPNGTIKNCIATVKNGNGFGTGSSTNSAINLFNDLSIVEGITGNGRGFIVRDDSNVANCIAYAPASASTKDGFIEVYADAKLTNCISIGFLNSYVPYGVGFGTSANNAASDGSTNTPPGSDPVTVDIPESYFVDSANGDFHLDPSASELIDGGFDNSSLFTDDIAGDARATPWDVGIFEYTGVAGLTVPEIIAMRQEMPNSLIQR